MVEQSAAIPKMPEAVCEALGKAYASSLVTSRSLAERFREALAHQKPAAKPQATQQLIAEPDQAPPGDS
jgi:hypothetical protein